MNKVLVTTAFVVLSLFIAKSQNVDQIAAKNITAVGGKEKISTINTIKLQSTIKLQGLEIENKTEIVVGRAIRSDSKIMNSTITQAYDGKMGWELTPILMGGSGEPKIMSEDMVKSYINQIDPFPFLDYDKKGVVITLLANEKINDKDTYHLSYQPTKGNNTEIWIDKSTDLVIKQKSVLNGQESEYYFSNYTEIDGIKFPMYLEILNPATGKLAIETKSIVLNSPVDDSIFNLSTVKI